MQNCFFLLCSVLLWVQDAEPHQPTRCCAMAGKAGNWDKTGNLQQVGAVCFTERRWGKGRSLVLRALGAVLCAPVWSSAGGSEESFLLTPPQNWLPHPQAAFCFHSMHSHAILCNLGMKIPIGWNPWVLQSSYQLPCSWTEVYLLDFPACDSACCWDALGKRC